ncbi:hypothetical protein [Acidianus bottle-shaped virus 3 strain ABV3]|uniref:Uncharacterized protein n=1 Tax=Acidianus bottle-shaped virus 3 strain ABV3 TaxID=1732174 RepID=A0A0N9NJJ1_9VIRU|nr:hypothetical protein AVU00_gp21 [Acidianus bottle-shaped virus 3 strain ABV3]ALG96823.1 hypothetical protein [Acidianus bottle-shaped virus 3 strain ABV3]
MFSIKDLIKIVENKKECLDYVLYRLDNEIILFTRGELFLKKKKFNLEKCDHRICKLIADKIIDECEQKEKGIVDCLIEKEEELEEKMVF